MSARLPIPAGPAFSTPSDARAGTAPAIDVEWRELRSAALPKPPDRAAFARACRAYGHRARMAQEGMDLSA